jgi:hypothetical protein
MTVKLSRYDVSFGRSEVGSLIADISVLLGQPQHNLPQLTLANAAETAPIIVATHQGSPIIRSRSMLWTITIILVILWIVGLVSSYTLGGWIHLLLVLAIIILIFNLLSGRRGI